MSYVHNEASQIGHRRPIPLYGDSFAACVTRECYQHDFNRDPHVSDRCLPLNYGVGAYGLDQTYLLLGKSVSLYRDPFVFFSLLTEDIDRAAHHVFVAQKPMFQVVEGQLVLDAEPIASDPRAYFEDHQPTVVSYLYRLLIHHPRPPKSLSAFLRGEAEFLPELGGEVGFSRQPANRRTSIPYFRTL